MVKESMIESCINAVRSLPQIQKVHFIPAQSGKVASQWDGIITIQIPSSKWIWIVEAKRHLALQSLPYLIRLKEKANSQTKRDIIIFTEYVTSNLARRLRDEGIHFIDTSGNVFLNYPGKLYIYIERQRSNRPLGIKKGRLFQPSGLQVLFTLLIDPNAVNVPYRNLAEKSGVALGTVGWVMRELRDKGFIELIGKRTYQLNNSEKLFDQWVTAYADRLRSKLFIGSYKTYTENLDTILGDLKSLLNLENIQWALTGGYGADALIHQYKGDTLTLFIQNPSEQIIRRLRWLPSSQGDIVLLRAFSPQVYYQPTVRRKLTLAHPLLIYAELLSSGAEREREIAHRIYQNFLESLFGKD